MGHSGSAGAKRAQNAKNAGNLKTQRVERTTGVCPICYKLLHEAPHVSFGLRRVSESFNHIAAHSRGI